MTKVRIRAVYRFRSKEWPIKSDWEERHLADGCTLERLRLEWGNEAAEGLRKASVVIVFANGNPHLIMAADLSSVELLVEERS